MDGGKVELLPNAAPYLKKGYNKVNYFRITFESDYFSLPVSNLKRLTCSREEIRLSKNSYSGPNLSNFDHPACRLPIIKGA